MRRFATHISALVGAIVGFYGGLATLLAAGGLESAAWSPLFMCSGAGLIAGAAVGIVSRRAGGGIWAIGAISGLVLGAIMTAIDPDLTVVVAFVAVLSQALAYLPHTEAWKRSGL